MTMTRKSTTRKFKILAPIKESTRDYERIEEVIIKAFRKAFFEPLMREFGLKRSKLLNSLDDLIKAISAGKITFWRGEFTGRFDATITKELRSLGATWDRDRAAFKLNLAEVPENVREAIRISDRYFLKRLTAVDRRLSEIDPKEISAQVKVSQMFDRVLWQVDKDLSKSLQNITVLPQISPETRKKIADEYQNNLEKDIKTFTDEMVIELRKRVQKVILAGNRYETMIDEFKATYGVTQRKARFWARQETGLLMAKFKESRYTQAGVHEYIWGCVAGSPEHPVRPAHKALQGTTHRWDNPPITTEPGQAERRNNPGEDYNCRCFARPIVKFR